MQPQRPYQPAPSDVDRQRAGFFRAGKVAAWVWVVVTVAPIVLVVGCCGLCMFTGVLGSALPDPTPTP